MATDGGRSAANICPTKELLDFYDSVDATLDTFTQATRMRPLDVTSTAAFTSWLRPFTDEGENWSYSTYRMKDGALRAIAIPTTDIGPSTRTLFPFVELHQLMSVWWLMAAWRTRQLLLTAEWALAKDLVVPAAACARGLVETAAQLHADAVKVAAGWDTLKLSMRGEQGAGFQERIALLRVLTDATMGAKFDEKAPALQETYGSIKRSNVLTAVDKLTRAFGPTWQEDYQWLCNVVHPSVGNFLSFASPFMGHESGTHLVGWFSGRSLAVVSGDVNRRQEDVSTAIERAIDRSAHVLLSAGDDALKVLDDVGLSTRAAEISTFDYWRAVRIRDRQAPCPCRSGRRAYRCPHVLGQAGPSIRPVTL